MPGRSDSRFFSVSFGLRLASAFILAVVLAVSLMLLRPRFLFQQGMRQMNMGSHVQAAVHFEQAYDAMPVFLSRTRLTAVDRFRLDTYYGRSLYESGKAAWQQNGLTRGVYAMFLSSRELLERAVAAEPGYYLTAYWQAQTEHVLERIHPWLFPGNPNPFDADEFYRHAAALRPAGINVRQAYARYLYHTGRWDRIPALLSNLLAIYPPIYEALKKEAYFTPALLPHMARGLESAVSKRVLPRHALLRLSRLYLDQNNPAAAIDTYEGYLAHDPGANTSDDFFYLGTLCVQDGRYEKSHEAFVQGLAAAEDREALLNRIYQHFRSLKQYTRFLSFIEYLEGTALAVPGREMLLARCYVDMDQLFLAKQPLKRIMETRPTGPAAYLRAVIAGREQDWDAMEAFSHQATRLDPGNSDHLFLFAQALNHRKKFASAEDAVTRATRHASRENSGYYHFRAWIRWHQEKYKQAALDWEKAAALNPENPDFAERARQARERIGLSPVTGN
jgi:tetratricopeptide (TPR) repeat protein